MDGDPVGGLGPLPLEVLGRRDDGDAVDLAAGQELVGEAEREGRLAGARCRGREEVPRIALEVGGRAPPPARRAACPPCPTRRAPGTTARGARRPRSAAVGSKRWRAVHSMRTVTGALRLRGSGATCVRVRPAGADRRVSSPVANRDQTLDASRMRSAWRSLMTSEHPWRRYVAIGDSFTEGIGDPEPGSPGGHRGWADRVAEVLAAVRPDFAYANLAVRGKLLAADRRRADRAGRRAAARPDHDLRGRQRRDPARHRSRRASPPSSSAALARLADDRRDDRRCSPASTSASRPSSGASAARSRSTTRTCARIAARHDCIVADQWALEGDPGRADVGRTACTSTPLGHHEVARMVLRALERPERPRADAAGAAAADDLACGALRGPRLGARVLRAVGASVASGGSRPATTSRRSARTSGPFLSARPWMPPAPTSRPPRATPCPERISRRGPRDGAGAYSTSEQNRWPREAGRQASGSTTSVVE